MKNLLLSLFVLCWCSCSSPVEPAVDFGIHDSSDDMPILDEGNDSYPDSDADVEMGPDPITVVLSQPPVLLSDRRWVSYDDGVGTLVGIEGERFEVTELRRDTYVRSIVAYKSGYALVRQSETLNLEYYENPATIVPSKVLPEPDCQRVLSYGEKLLLACRERLLVVEETLLDLRVTRTISRVSYLAEYPQIGVAPASYVLREDTLYEQIAPQPGFKQVLVWNLLADTEEDLLVGVSDSIEGNSQGIQASEDFIYMPIAVGTPKESRLYVYSRNPFELADTWEVSAQFGDNQTGGSSVYANDDWVAIPYRNFLGTFTLVFDATSTTMTCLGVIPFVGSNPPTDFRSTLAGDQILYATEEVLDYPLLPYTSSPVAEIQLADCPL